MGIIAVIITFVCICVDNLVSANMSALKLTKENKSIFSVKIALFFTAANVILFTLGYLVSIFFFHNWVYFAHNWVAFAFFLLLGIKLMLESIEKSPSFGDADAGDLWKLIKVSTIIGLNGFLVGYALETVNRGFFPDVLFLLVITFVMTILGAHLGGSSAQEYRRLLSKRLELVAGIILIIMAIRFILI